MGSLPRPYIPLLNFLGIRGPAQGRGHSHCCHGSTHPHSTKVAQHPDSPPMPRPPAPAPAGQGEGL